MTIEFKCTCGATLKAKSEAAGKRIKCSKCEDVVCVPVREMQPDGLNFDDLADLERQSKPVLEDSRNAPIPNRRPRKLKSNADSADMRAMQMQAAANAAPPFKRQMIDTVSLSTVIGVAVTIASGGNILLGAFMAFVFVTPLLKAINRYRRSTARARTSDTMECPNCGCAVLTALRFCPSCNHGLSELAHLIKSRSKLISWLAILLIFYVLVVSFVAASLASNIKLSGSSAIRTSVVGCALPFGVAVAAVLYKVSILHRKIRSMYK